MPDRIDDFIGALQDEIEAVKKSRAGATQLSDGTLVGQSGESSIYTFTASRLLTSEDETPARLEIDGRSYDCAIVTCNGLFIHIAVSQPLGKTIDAATLTTNRTIILARLIDRLREAKTNRKNLQLADDVFIARSKPIAKFGSRARYSYQPHSAPNISQAEAIENSFSNSLAVIWGPPGTGKTRTIARAVEAHLEAGRRVLLVSHANTAVDAALEDIAGQLATTYYAQGKIIRLGAPKDANLAKNYPLVLLDKVVAQTNHQLLNERDRLAAHLKPLEENLKQCQALKKAADAVREMEKEQQRPSQLAPYQQRHNQIQADIARAQAEIALAHRNGSAPFLAEHLNDLNIFIATRKRFAEEIELKLAEHASRADQREAELVAANQLFDDLMESTGISPNGIGDRIEACAAEVKGFSAKIIEIEKHTDASMLKAINEARVVGTTLSRLFYTSALNNQDFDILIVDEASMAPLPHLYFALTKITQGVTLVGDFKQLPPIVMSESAAARKWLGESIFDQLAISTVEKAKQTALVSLLDTQYRMAPQIATVASDLFYGGALQSAPSTNDLGLNDSIFAASRVVIVDTSQVDPWCTSPPSGSRLNIYSAGLAVTIAERLLREHPNISLGIAAPYRPHAEYIARAISECHFGERATVNTVHGFQGGECSAIIFDCVDGKGSKKSLLDDNINGPLNGHISDHTISSTNTPGRFGGNVRTAHKSIADVLLNVALTRARDLFVLIVNKKHFEQEAKDSVICRFIAALSVDAITINARDLDDGFIARPLTESGANAAPTYQRNPASTAHNEKDFWPTFNQDLAGATETALIVSPFLTSKRSQHFYKTFENLVAHGINVQVYTKPTDEHSRDYMVKEAETVIRQLENIGIKVLQRSKIHQKIVIIDDFICWEGSLNILSYNDSLEHMRRFESNAIATELRRNLRLE